MFDTRPHDAVLSAPQVVRKPWGHEVIFAAHTGSYAGKVITVDPDQALSTQYHDDKDETMHVLSGTMELLTGPRGSGLAQLSSQILRPGQSVHLAPGVVHAVHALGDEPLVFVEASTALDGWEEDVVRLDDSYGRIGTTAP